MPVPTRGEIAECTVKVIKLQNACGHIIIVRQVASFA